MYNDGYQPPKDGLSAGALRLRAQNARMALSSSPPTPAQAIEAVRALTSHWSHDLPDERLDSIAAVFMRFPRGVVAACVGLDGIACCNIRDTRTGKCEPRRYVPSDGEIRHWCNEHLADLHEIAKVGDLVLRPAEAPSIEPQRQDPTPDEIAHVWRVVDQIKQRCNAVLGVPTEEDRRREAERILEAARQR